MPNPQIYSLPIQNISRNHELKLYITFFKLKGTVNGNEEKFELNLTREFTILPSFHEESLKLHLRLLIENNYRFSFRFFYYFLKTMFLKTKDSL